MIRVRFAPSPTGFLHIGGLRTCLYDWLFAKKNKGKLILRIEDTDRSRFVEGAIENLIKVLKKFNLNWDEGPILTEKQNSFKQKGKYGPYIQSQRVELYKNFARKLVENDRAYYCFCSKKRLKKMHEEQRKKGLPPMYDGKCRNLTEEEIKEKMDKKIPYVIRLKVPRSKNIQKNFGTRQSNNLGFTTPQGIVFKDLIWGEIKIDYKDIDDQILLKSDGWPTYHLANVVDDHLMHITHVIRGEEWLPSTPKHILLYEAFGWKPPQFIHLPLLLNPDKSKLSKRQGDVAVEDYLAKGYLPEAILNFIALLGWNPGTTKEIFTLKELIKTFSISRIQKSGAIFDRKKLDWMNGYYIRQMNLVELTNRCVPYLIQYGSIKQIKNQNFYVTKTKKIISFTLIKKIIKLEQERLKRLDEIGKLTQFFFVDKIEYDPQLLQWKNMSKEQIKNNLEKIKAVFARIAENKFTAENIIDSLTKLSKEVGTGEIFWPLRVSLTGQKFSPPPQDIAEILGKDKVIFRLNQAIDKLV